MLRLLHDAERSRALVAERSLKKPRAIYSEPWSQMLVHSYVDHLVPVEIDKCCVNTASQQSTSTKNLVQSLTRARRTFGLQSLLRWMKCDLEAPVDHPKEPHCYGPLQVLASDIEILRSMVKKLQAAADAIFLAPLNMTGISQPFALSQSQTWLFSEAVRVAGLSIVDQGWDRDTSTVFAAPAACGIGMCEPYRRPSLYIEEGNALKSGNLLILEYTDLVYSAQIMWVFEGSLNIKDEDFIYGSSGLGSKSAFRLQVGEDAYWMEICARTQSLLESSARSGMFPTRVILVGDRAKDRDFLRDCLSNASNLHYQSLDGEYMEQDHQDSSDLCLRSHHYRPGCEVRLR